jgi:hypothetical protein
VLELISSTTQSVKDSLVFSVIALVLSGLSILFGIYTWYQSGGRLKTRIWLEVKSSNRLEDTLRIEVINVGRQAAILRKIEIGHRYKTGTTTSNGKSSLRFKVGSRS